MRSGEGTAWRTCGAHETPLDPSNPPPSLKWLERVSLSGNRTPSDYNKHIVAFTKLPHSLSHLPSDKHIGYQVLPCYIPCILGS